MFGLIDSLGGGELLAVLIMLMVVVGPDRLPEVARKIGKGIAQARAQISSMSDEVREVVDDPAMQPLRKIGEFAMRPRKKLSEIVRMAELDLTEESAAKKAAAVASDTTGSTGSDQVEERNDEPGEPPRAGPQLPLNVDDKLAGRSVPVDVEVAAEAEAVAEAMSDPEAEVATADEQPEVAAAEEQPEVAGEAAQGPDHVAFSTRAAPLVDASDQVDADS